MLRWRAMLERVSDRVENAEATRFISTRANAQRISTAALYDGRCFAGRRQHRNGEARDEDAAKDFKIALMLSPLSTIRPIAGDKMDYELPGDAGRAGAHGYISMPDKWRYLLAMADVKKRSEPLAYATAAPCPGR